MSIELFDFKPSGVYLLLWLVIHLQIDNTLKTLWFIGAEIYRINQVVVNTRWEALLRRKISVYVLMLYFS